MRIRALFISASLLAFAAPVYAQAADSESPQTVVSSGFVPVVTVELASGYLIQSPNYLVTDEPVIQTNVFVPLTDDLFVGLLHTTELSNAGLFDKASDKIDVTFGGNIERGAYTLRARTSWYATPGSRNDIVLVEGGVSRAFAEWIGSVSIEFQNFGGGVDNAAILHMGASRVVPLFGQDFTLDAGVHQFDEGYRTYTGTITTYFEVNGVTLRPRIRFSAANEGDSNITFGIAHTF